MSYVYKGQVKKTERAGSTGQELKCPSVCVCNSSATVIISENGSMFVFVGCCCCLGLCKFLLSFAYTLQLLTSTHYSLIDMHCSSFGSKC